MESTGVLWRPVADRLAGDFELVLVNATHMKRVPGRKTDGQDAEWLTDLLQHGLLTPSFVPDQAQQVIDWLEQTAVGWNKKPTPFI
jgi:transposase